MDESSETSSAKDVPAGSLRAALSELKRLIQNVLDGADSTVSWQHRDTLACACPLAQVTELAAGFYWVLKSPVSKKTAMAHRDGLSQCTAGSVCLRWSAKSQAGTGDFGLQWSDHHEFQAHATVIGLGVVPEHS